MVLVVKLFHFGKHHSYAFSMFFGSYSYMDDHGPACTDNCTDQDLYSVCAGNGTSCLDDCSEPDMWGICMVLPSMCQEYGLDPTPVDQVCSTVQGSYSYGPYSYMGIDKFFGSYGYMDDHGQGLGHATHFGKHHSYAFSMFFGWACKKK